jgi:Fe-S cluster biogenesis protein NfuA
MFRPNHRVLPESISAPYIEYLSPRDTISPPHPSPLAAKLMDIDGVISVFYGSDFITVTKKPETEWAHVRPEVFALITETVASGAPIITASGENKDAGAASAAGEEKDSLAEDPDDDPVVGMIKELLATRIRPAIQDDGGDIDYRGFENGYVLLKLRGACRTCSSGENTLKQGIEGMLMHYVSLAAGRHPRLQRIANTFISAD